MVLLNMNKKSFVYVQGLCDRRAESMQLLASGAYCLLLELLLLVMMEVLLLKLHILILLMEYALLVVINLRNRSLGMRTHHIWPSAKGYSSQNEGRTDSRGNMYKDPRSRTSMTKHGCKREYFCGCVVMELVIRIGSHAGRATVT